MRHYLMFLTAIIPIWWAVALRYEFHRTDRAEPLQLPGDPPAARVVDRSRAPYWILAAAGVAFLLAAVCGCGGSRYRTGGDAVADIAFAWCQRAVELEVYRPDTRIACETGFVDGACEDGGCDDPFDGDDAEVDACLESIATWDLGQGILPPTCEGIL